MGGLVYFISLANAYRLLGGPGRAAPLYEEALGIRRELLGSDHVDTANVLESLGIVQCASGKLTEALSSHQECLEIRKRVLGERHAHVATSLVHVARLYEDLEEPAKSLPIWDEAVSIEREVLGADSLKLASTVSR